MKPERKCSFLCIAAALIFLLGLVRGIGSIVAILNDVRMLAALNSASIFVALIVVGFILLSAATVITAIAIFEHNKKYLLAGILLTLIFVVSGVVNRNLLIDKTTYLGTIINIIAGIIIIAFLMIGKKVLDKSKRNI